MTDIARMSTTSFLSYDYYKISKLSHPIDFLIAFALIKRVEVE